jgi:hypothetical protein
VTHRIFLVPLFVLLLLNFVAAGAAVAQGGMPNAGDAVAAPLQTPVPAIGGQAVYLPAIARPGSPQEGTPTPTDTIKPTDTSTPTETAIPTETTKPTETVTPSETVTPTPTLTPTETRTAGAPLLVPFDANVEDLAGPSDWSTQYGKTPEIIVASNGVELDVLAQDYGLESPWKAVLLHISANGTGYQITQALSNIPMLDRVMGLAVDAEGNRYYATGIDEANVVNPNYPPLDTYRSNIVRVVKVNPAGAILFDIDLDPARHAFDGGAEMIVNPMVVATARLAVGGNEIALVHGINTAPDWNIGGARHQKALSTRLNAGDGAILATSSVWVSHSFDQRLLYDGEGMIEYHLGDAYPRYLVFARNQDEFPLFYIKGDVGNNRTATQLGNIALIEDDSVYGYLALFATESSDVFDADLISGPRNLAIVRVKRSDNSLDPNLPDVLTVLSSEVLRSNRLRWLTHFSAASKLHAERPKLVGIGGDEYVVLWEQWLVGGGADVFQGVYGMVIDAAGNTVQAATLITDQHHLQRGDDAFRLNGRASWMTGNASTAELYIHLVDARLNYEVVKVPLP